MNIESFNHLAEGKPGLPPSQSPILLVPYMWIGDFIRCHSVIKVLRERWPDRPVDLLTSRNGAPLTNYMPGVRKGIVWDLPRGRLPIDQYFGLARHLRREGYGSAVIAPRTWKAALAPFLAGIPERVGFVGEARIGLINDLRWGERRLERMIDRCCALALPKGASLPAEWPLPELVVPAAEVAAWVEARGPDATSRRILALCPGAIGPGKRWSAAHFAELARLATGRGLNVWVVGSPNEAAWAREITASGGRCVTDLTGPDLRNAILALKAADAVVSNDSGLMHVAAALGTATIALFGPTSPRLWAPLNPLAAALEPMSGRRCPACGITNCAEVTHRQIDDITPARVFEAVRHVIDRSG
jgi:heptosyltransferase-2